MRKLTIISGTGSYIPNVVKRNEDFLNNTFFTAQGKNFEYENKEVISKFKAITGIEERRYVTDNLTASEIGSLAGKEAIKNAKISKEEIDYIIVAHNFGDVTKKSVQGDTLPSLASKIKHKLKIANPNCIAYDIIFGCPGWIQGVIQADAFIKTGIAKKCLVIGTETLSRVVDVNDRDSMIYADGAGACIVEKSNEEGKGILSHATQTHTLKESNYLFFGKAFNKALKNGTKYIKMHGRKIYEFALTNVPFAMKHALEKSGLDINSVRKILIHQANEKMDEAIIKRFYRLFKLAPPKNIMPMTIHELGNSSVATVPTLLDLLLHNKIENHNLNTGDAVLFASVGAGMNINAIVYQF